MRLLSFQVRGYKNFRQPLRMEQLGRINLIHGENNVGKSNLLEAIGLLFVLLGQMSVTSGRQRSLHRSQEDSSGDEAADAFTRRVPWNLFEKRGYPPSEIFHLEHAESIEVGGLFELTMQELEQAGIAAPFPLLSVDVALQLREERESAQVQVVRLRLGDNHDVLALKDQPEIVELARLLITHLARGPLEERSVRPRFILLKADRSLLADPPLTESASATDRVPVPRDFCLQLYDAKESLDRRSLPYRRWDRFVSALGRFEDLLGPGKFTALYERQTDEAQLAYETSTARIPLRLLGSGVQQVANLIGRLVMSGADIAAIEEPELNLRYTLQLKLRDIFGELIGEDDGPAQLFLTSHSPAFESEPCFYAMRAGENGPRIERRPAEQAEEFTGQTAIHRPPSGQDAPLSYVTSEGLVLVPEEVRRLLHLEHGGGVVFVERKDTGHMQMLTHEQFLDLLEPKE